MRLGNGLAVPVMMLLCACAPIRPPAGSIPPVAAAENPPRNWHLLDESLDHFPGISAERAYRELLKNRTPARAIVVAVIDMGIDTTHRSLYPILWTNTREIPGNNIDDDHNGYVDDVHGWNFAGGRDGRNVEYAPLEVTRLYRVCTDSSAPFPTSSAKPANCAAIVKDYVSSKIDADKDVAITTADLDTLKAATLVLANALGSDAVTMAKVAALKSSNAAVQDAQKIWMRYVDDWGSEAALANRKEETAMRARVWFDPEFDESAIVHDNPNDPWQHDYGNNDVNGPRPFHGTHIAGIIGGLPDSGVSGIAHGIRIMSVRSTCRCDERDKDVANAIRYAVDNGANIISMSFGKDYSPQKLAVDSAVKYADSKGVLMVHGAGNNASDLATRNMFPLPRYLDGASPTNWIEVGASTWKKADTLAARFSNYGRDRVDLFAPGSDIYSTFLGGKYARLSGTSMAGPMVAGIAAVLMQYYPELSATDVKRIILTSAIRYPDRLTIKPGTKADHVPFGQLSATGGIANLYAALRLAEQGRKRSR
jgi:subtilisin family serine protease